MKGGGTIANGTVLEVSWLSWLPAPGIKVQGAPTTRLSVGMYLTEVARDRVLSIVNLDQSWGSLLYEGPPSGLPCFLFL